MHFTIIINKNIVYFCDNTFLREGTIPQFFFSLQTMQHCKTRSVPNVHVSSFFCWAFPLLTSWKRARKTFQLIYILPTAKWEYPPQRSQRTCMILKRLHRKLVWIDSPLKLPLKCLKKWLNWDIVTYPFENLCLLRRRAFLCDELPILEARKRFGSQKKNSEISPSNSLFRILCNLSWP